MSKMTIPELLVMLESIGIGGAGEDASAALSQGFEVEVNNAEEITVRTPRAIPGDSLWLTLRGAEGEAGFGRRAFIFIRQADTGNGLSFGEPDALLDVSSSIVAKSDSGSGISEDGFGVITIGGPSGTGAGRPIAIGYVKSSNLGDPFEDARIGRAAVAQADGNSRFLPAVSSIVDNFDGTFDLVFASPHQLKPWELVSITGFSQAGAEYLNTTQSPVVVNATTARFINAGFVEITDVSCSAAIVASYTGGLMKNGATWVIPRRAAAFDALDVEGALIAGNGVETDYGSGLGLYWHDGVSRRRIGHGARSVTCAAGNEVVTAASGIIRGVDKLMLTAAAAVTVGTAATKPILPDSYDGHTICLINVGANNITLTDQGTMAASNLRLTATTVVLGARDSVELTYSSTVGDWVQTGNLVNVL